MSTATATATATTSSGSTISPRPFRRRWRRRGCRGWRVARHDQVRRRVCVPTAAADGGARSRSKQAPIRLDWGARGPHSRSGGAGRREFRVRRCGRAPVRPSWVVPLRTEVRHRCRRRGRRPRRRGRAARCRRRVGAKIARRCRRGRRVDAPVIERRQFVVKIVVGPVDVAATRLRRRVRADRGRDRAPPTADAFRRVRVFLILLVRRCCSISWHCRRRSRPAREHRGVGRRRRLGQVVPNRFGHDFVCLLRCRHRRAFGFRQHVPLLRRRSRPVSVD